MSAGCVFVAAGHGGDDTGATLGGLCERDLNASVTGLLVARLRDHGITVETDLEHGNPSFPEETEVARRLGPVAYYVAIHHNWHETAARGAEAFGLLGAGLAFARALLDEVVPALRLLDPSLPDRSAREGADTGAAKHLRLAPGLVAVIEPCFLSSAADRRIVEDERYPGLLAEALCRGVIDHGRVDGLWPAVYDRGGIALPPVASVLVPTRDRPDLVQEAVGSVLAQTVTGIEVVVVDDGGSAPVGPFADERVRVVRLDGCRGPAAARNAGMDVARGRVLAFLDDDDLWVPNRLDLALRALRRAPVTVCATRHIGARSHSTRRLEGWIGSRLLESTTPCLGATAVRTEVAPRFDERWLGIEDVMWWWELVKRAPVATEPDIGYLVRLHDGQRGANTLARRVDENLTLLREQADFFSRHPAAAAHRWLRVGLLSQEAGQHRTALRAFAHHVALRPRPAAVAHMVVAAAALAAGRRERDRLVDRPLRVTHLLLGDYGRGAELAARHLADALTVDGSVNRVVAVRRSAAAGRVRVDRVLLKHRPRHVLHWAAPVAIARLRRDVRRAPCDVLLAHGAGPALLATVASLFGSMPPVVWQRILTFPQRPHWHPKWLCWRFVTARIAGVVALTPSTAVEVRQLGYRGPVWIVPNHRPAARFAGIDRDVAARRLRTELGIPQASPVIGFIGHLVAQKRPAAALDVLQAVQTVCPEARLIVAGAGPLGHEVAERAAAFGGAVHLLGHREDVAWLLAGIDVLIVPSRTDSMPGIVVEAQLVGCPTVAYPLDAIEDLLAPGPSGVVTAAHDPAEMAAAVTVLLRDPQRRAELSAAGRRLAPGLETEGVAARYRSLLWVAAGGGETRVVHVIPDLGTGGAEQALAVLGAHLDPHRFAQVVATVGGDRRPRHETVGPELDRLAVGRCDLGLRRRPTRSATALLLATWRLRRLVRRFDADVVDAALLDATLPARLAPLPGARVSHVVNTPWDGAVARATGTSLLRRSMLRAADRWTSSRDDALVAITDAVAASVRRELGERIGRRVVVIPRGVDVDHFTERPPDARQARTGLRVLSVGRLVPQKGHDTLVAAVATCHTMGYDVRLEIVGEGPGKAGLAALARRLGVADRVAFSGTRRDVRAALVSADVFALASRWEGQSNAVLEAMATALCVVVSDVPALREVVDGAGCLVPPDDAQAWADVLVALMGDPDRRERLGRAARHRVTTTYSATSRAAELGAFYQRLRYRRRGADRVVSAARRIRGRRRENT